MRIFLFDEARAINPIISPHPMLRIPSDAIRENFEAETRSDPDVPLLLQRLVGIGARDFRTMEFHQSCHRRRGCA